MSTKKFTLRLSYLILVTFVFCLAEWGFFMSKPSFMSSLNTAEKYSNLFFANLWLFSFSFTGFLFLEFLSWVISKIRKKEFHLSNLMTALLSSLLSIILIDNFLYTIVRYGIINSNRFVHYIYIGLAVYFFYRFFQFFSKKTIDFSQPKKNLLLNTSSISILVISILFTYSVFNSNFSKEDPSNFDISENALKKKDFPNILFLSSDALNATQLSVYGYTKRKNTPFLESQKKHSLFFENAFTNNRKTAGSLAAALSGRHPLKTKMLFPPQIYRGLDSYHHLPGILKSLGYETHQLTLRNYSDAIDQNFQNSFTKANHRKIPTNLFSFVPLPIHHTYNAGFYFLTRSFERLANRFLGLIGVWELVNFYRVVTKPRENEDHDFTDASRIKYTLEAFEKAKGPAFVQVHLDRTHCCTYHLTKPHFTKGLKQNKSNELLFYDDSIYQADNYFKQVFEGLEKMGKLQNTLIVIFSDHGRHWDPNVRVPLMFFFPKRGIKGTVKENVQLADISPTILDYLHLKKPEWMTGKTMLKSESTSIGHKTIFTTVESDTRFPGQTGIRFMRKVGPPLFGLQKLVAVECNRYYFLDLENGSIYSGAVPGHTAPCAPESLPSKKEMRERMTRKVLNHGYRPLFLKQDAFRHLALKLE